ncbi:hypothetical protein [Psychromonas arctica]|uniref:hypothetical protein n=1 Tax=Psychromonas arctica TaxID=168275 RepID=UPI002FD52B35
MRETIEVAPNVSDLRVINQAADAWLPWNAIGVEERLAVLEQWSALLKFQQCIDLLASQVIEYHCQQATKLIAEPLNMPGPTGESNILSTSGRGVFLIMAEENSSVIAFTALLSCALVGGNSLIVTDTEEHKALFEVLQQACDLSMVAMPVCFVKDNQALENLLDDDVVAGVGYVGDEQKVIELNRIIANRTGQIATFITETDLLQLETSRDQNLVLRFITEKTLSTNVTAVGGNATLLALGCGDE